MPPTPKIGSLIRGNKGEYRLERVITEGNMSWAIEAVDTKNGNKKVFLKYYKSPTPKVDWYKAYIRYVETINERLQETRAAQYCVLCNDSFTANPKPGMCRTEYLYQAYDFIESGCDLRSLLDKKNPDWEYRKVVAKVFLVSMCNIHAAKVVHCDLKPENVQMVQKNGAKVELVPRLIDMDRSILADVKAPWVGGQNPEGYTGTPGYMSPEHVSGKTPLMASDVFTVGLILSELLAGIKPFGKYTEPEAYKKAVLQGGSFDGVKLLGELGNHPENAATYAALIERCFDPKPENRPTCAELHKNLIELDRDSARRKTTPPSAATTSPKTKALLLSGDVGSMKILLNMDLGKDGLGRISSQARFAHRAQFRVECRDEHWYLNPCAGTPNATALNGDILEKEVPLNEGDMIALKGRASGKIAMQLRVSFE